MLIKIKLKGIFLMVQTKSHRHIMMYNCRQPSHPERYKKHKSPLHPNKLHCVEWHVDKWQQVGWQHQVIKETLKSTSQARHWRTGGKHAGCDRKTGKSCRKELISMRTQWKQDREKSMQTEKETSVEIQRQTRQRQVENLSMKHEKERKKEFICEKQILKDKKKKLKAVNHAE